MSDQQPVLFEERAAGRGKKLAIATLNAEKSLNSLTLEMIDLLQEKFTAWEKDQNIACVLLQGAGDKAFCAGGDVVALHRGSAAYGEALPDNSARDFFAREYILDHHIHVYRKPVVLWGNGIVMGGGLGLMSGASHRVVTESTRMAMPEITIGLFPDVGGTWFLNHAPGRTGLFLGLTGANINAADAKFVGLADRFVTHDRRDAVIEALCNAEWQDNADSNRGLVTHLLRDFEKASRDQQPQGNVYEHLDWINDITDGDDIVQIVEQITAYDGDDKWLARAAKTLAGGCPVTPHLVQLQMSRGKHMSLADVFRMELILAANCAARGHFKEGVRALLIDKDQEPKWIPSNVAEVSAEEIAAFTEEPWDEHPLAHL